MKRIVTFVICCATLALAGCIKDQPETGLAGRTVSFQGTIYPLTPYNTRVSESAWTQGDAIGVYMIPAGKTIALNDPAAKSNMKHDLVDVANGKFAAEGDSKLFYPATGTVDFVAYYPYIAIGSGEYAIPVDVTNQTNLSALDLMYSNNAKGLSSGNPTLQFTHRLTKLVINVADVDGNSIEGISATIRGISKTGTFDLSSGVFTLNAGNKDFIYLDDPLEDGNLAAFEAIVPPHADITGISLLLVLNKNVAEIKLREPDADVPIVSFEGGKKYTYNIKLSSSITVGTGIGPWDDGGSDDKWDQWLVPGSEARPFSAAELIGNIKDLAGLNNKWVKGYIVGTGEDGIKPIEDITSKASILLAGSPDEIDKTKCIVIDLATPPDAVTGTMTTEEAAELQAAIQTALNLVDNPDLIGADVMVRGLVSNSLTGAATTIGLTKLTAEMGGKDPEPAGPTEYFSEDFGEGGNPAGMPISDYTNGGVTYSNGGATVPVVKSTGMGTDLFMYLPDGSNDIGIDGLPAGYTGITLSLDLAALSGTPENPVTIYVNDSSLTLTPKDATNTDNLLSTDFAAFTVTLTDNTSSIRLVANVPAETGIKIDNITLTGIAE